MKGEEKGIIFPTGITTVKFFFCYYQVDFNAEIQEWLKT